MQDLTNKVIWITGGTRGIGLETAKALLPLNCKLVLTSSTESAVESAKAIFANNPNVMVSKCNVADACEVADVYDEIIAKFGTIDALLNNAGIFRSSSVLKTNIDDFDDMININLKGVFLCTKAVLPRMLEAKFGVIMNTVSVVARKPFYGCSVYAASKAGVEAFANVLREEVRKSGIRVINVFPGATATEIWDPKNLEKFADAMMKTSDVATVLRDTLVQSFTSSIAVEEIQLRPINGDL